LFCFQLQYDTTLVPVVLYSIPVIRDWRDRLKLNTGPIKTCVGVLY
jgi:hypothetical protein